MKQGRGRLGQGRTRGETDWNKILRLKHARTRMEWAGTGWNRMEQDGTEVE